MQSIHAHLEGDAEANDGVAQHYRREEGGDEGEIQSQRNTHCVVILQAKQRAQLAPIAIALLIIRLLGFHQLHLLRRREWRRAVRSNAAAHFDGGGARGSQHQGAAVLEGLDPARLREAAQHVATKDLGRRLAPIGVVQIPDHKAVRDESAKRGGPPQKEERTLGADGDRGDEDCQRARDTSAANLSYRPHACSWTRARRARGREAGALKRSTVAPKDTYTQRADMCAELPKSAMSVNIQHTMTPTHAPVSSYDDVGCATVASFDDVGCATVSSFDDVGCATVALLVTTVPFTPFTVCASGIVAETERPAATFKPEKSSRHSAEHSDASEAFCRHSCSAVQAYEANVVQAPKGSLVLSVVISGAAS